MLTSQWGLGQSYAYRLSCLSPWDQRVRSTWQYLSVGSVELRDELASKWDIMKDFLASCISLLQNFKAVALGAETGGKGLFPTTVRTPGPGGEWVM